VPKVICHLEGGVAGMRDGFSADLYELSGLAALGAGGDTDHRQPLGRGMGQHVW